MMQFRVPLFTLLVSFSAFAEEPAGTVPARADPTGLIVFLLIMIGMIGGFFWYIWRKEKEKKEKKSGTGTTRG